MARQLPPLNALRALEAAGRHQSFTRAAAELCVTPGAVSRQIGLLEDHLGMQLFDRSGNTLSLTDRGRDYVHALTDAFGRMDLATQKLLNSDREQQLHITCSMTVTLRWLLPRLTSFHTQYPKRELRLSTALPVPALLSAADLDVAIRLDPGYAPHLRSDKLFECELIPVCSPKLLQNGVPLKEPADLARHTLLHSTLRPQYWSQWLDATETTIKTPAGVQFGSSSLAYQAAEEGLGIAIGQIALVLDHLRSGQLVAPFPVVVVVRDAFHVVHERDATSAKIGEFRDWIIAEAAQHNADIEKHTSLYRRLRGTL